MKPAVLACCLLLLPLPTYARPAVLCVLSRSDAAWRNGHGQQTSCCIQIFTLRIRPDGTLTQPQGFPLYHGNDYLEQAVATAGKHFYFLRATEGRSVLSSYTVHTDGGLTPSGHTMVGDWVKGGDFINLISIDPRGKFVWGACCYNPREGRYQYRVRPDGSLADLSWAPKRIGYPYVMSFNPCRPYVYVANCYAPYNGTLSEYHLMPNGKMFLLRSRLFLDSISIPVSAFTPDGRFLYLMDDRFGGLYSYRVRSDGTLQSLRHPLLPGGTDIVVAPSGHYLYAFGTKYVIYPDLISRYRIERNGLLTPAPPDTTVTKALADPQLFIGRYAYGVSGRDIVQMKIGRDGKFHPVSDASIPGPGPFVLSSLSVLTP